MLPQPKLLLLGHGVIAETLASIAKQLEFHVTVHDPLATEERFPTADARIREDPEYAKLDCDANTYVVIATQHKSDYEALTAVLRRDLAYVGLVASTKRAALVFERLYEDGYRAAELERVCAPCGLDVGAQSPQEIALAIVAEIVQRKTGGETTGRPLVERKGTRITDAGVEIPEGPLSDRCPS